VRCRVKKNADAPPALAGDALPAGALGLYEKLRAAMLVGQPCAGVAAIAFHGLWRGLQVLKLASTSVPTVVAPPLSPIPAAPHDRQLVRLLANMVLATQSQDCHAY